MILADTSLWIDHIREPDPLLMDHLKARRILAHPFVLGEVTMGRLKARAAIVSLMQNLRMVVLAEDYEVLRFVERNELFGIGIGYIDAHLLASVQLTSGATLWTRDKRLHQAATKLGIDYKSPRKLPS